MEICSILYVNPFIYISWIRDSNRLSVTVFNKSQCRDMHLELFWKIPMSKKDSITPEKFSWKSLYSIKTTHWKLSTSMFKYGYKSTWCVECAAACSLVDLVLLSLFLLVTFKRQPQTNCLSVYDHFVGLTLKALKIFSTNFAFNPVYYLLSKTSNNGYLSIKVTPNQQSLSSNTLKLKSYETNSSERPVKFGHYE